MSENKQPFKKPTKADIERFHQLLDAASTSMDELAEKRDTFKDDRDAFKGHCDVLKKLYGFDPKSQTINEDGEVVEGASEKQKSFVMTERELNMAMRQARRGQR